ncbi:putative transcriptional regulator [Megalodesulfovibrio gigas DSM 1382 = ATCC 19364]|uniref:Putative transcriptional regulator n=1 Tax=Megalodesulfovibrio gigas (strain ATCC 19364 / DSM 1382 / NCIMB 9332 / VKM B-1759) TaxID=1121448 RepID=T2G9U7_MEGG1|nr:putative transcriptional regulator [Megalodesulfovibrio gigas DSM 1382 = ATCC 19364]
MQKVSPENSFQRHLALAKRIPQVLSFVVAVQQIAQGTEHRAFAAGAAALGRSLEHAAGQTGKRERLQPDASRTAQGGKEQPLPAEEGGLDVAGLLNVEVHLRLKGHHAARVHVEHLPRGQLPGNHGAAGVDEGHAVAFQLLHDEALAAKQAGEDAFLKEDADAHAPGGTQEAVLLADERAVGLGQIHGDDIAREGRAKGHHSRGVAAVGKDGHEHAFAGEHALAGTLELVHEAATRGSGRAIAKDGLHVDNGILEHHGPGLGHNGVARGKLHFHELHLRALDLVFDLVRTPANMHARRRRRGRSHGPLVGHQFLHLIHGQPVGKALAPGVAGAVLPGSGPGLGQAHGAFLTAGIAHIPLGHARSSFEGNFVNQPRLRARAAFGSRPSRTARASRKACSAAVSATMATQAAV